MYFPEIVDKNNNNSGNSSTGVLISPWPDKEGNKLGSMSGDVRDFKNIETRAVIKFFFLQGKAPKEIHIILTEK